MCAWLRLRLDSSWDLQRGRQGTDWETPSTLPSRMAAWHTSARLQGCLYRTSIQAERKPPGLWQPPWNIPAVGHRQGPGQSATGNQFIDHLEQGLLPESQCDFWKDCWAIDMVFAARQLQEKCQEQNTDLCSTFVDLTKFFDTVTVSRDGLWRIMSKYICPTKFITIMRQFHDSMLASLQDNGETSAPFLVSNRVKQSCVLAPTLFSVMFSVMLSDTFRDLYASIGIRYRYSRSLFNLKRILAKTKVSTDTINDLLFANDCALNAPSEADMQHSVDKFSDACNNFGLTISTKKTEVMHQPAPGKPYVEPNISVDRQRLNVVKKFTYLGSTLSCTVVINDEVNTRLTKTSAAFGRHHKNVLDRWGITRKTNIKAYNAAVLTTLLYGCESWTVYQCHARKLNHFHTTSLRKLGKKWQDKIPDTEVLTRANLSSIHTILMQTQLCCAGHVHCSSHAGLLAPQETLVWRTPTWQTLPWRPEEAL